MMQLLSDVPKSLIEDLSSLLNILVFDNSCLALHILALFNSAAILGVFGDMV